MMWLLTAWGGVKRLFGFVVAYPWQAALAIALLACGFFYGAWQEAVAEVGKEHAAHIATKVGYANAQKVAAELNKKQVARIESEYAAIAERTESDYEKRLIDNRAALREWMRGQGARGNAESATTGSAAEIQPQVAGTSEVPYVPTGFAIVPYSDLELVADAYAKLAALQDAAIAVGNVRTE